jgi:hypothetical protein
MQRTSRISLALLLVFGGAIFISQAASIQEARVQYHAGKLDPALEQTNVLLKTNPDSISALFLKAQIQSENRQLDQAIATYKTLIVLDPEHLQAYNNLAALYAQQGKLELASETLEQAILTDPVYTTIHTNLRAIYMDMSKKHYRQALKLKPEGSSTQIASIDLSDNTDQILSEEVQVVPQSIQAAINTTIVRNSVTSNRTSRASESIEPILVAKNPQKVEAEPSSKAKNTAVVTAPAKPTKTPELVASTNIVGSADTAKTSVAQATVKPVSDAKPVPKVAPKADPAHEVKKSLLSWANAWSNRDVKRYTASYKKNYAPAGKTHKDWVAGRRWNFKNKKYIKVSLSGIRIKADNKRYRATFKQRYESNTYKDVVNKEIIFVRQNGQWKIAKEMTK